MSESSSVRPTSAERAGAASNRRMSGGPQARPTAGLIHWQSFAKNFMFFVRQRRSAVGRVSDFVCIQSRRDWGPCIDCTNSAAYLQWLALGIPGLSGRLRRHTFFGTERERRN